jgi:glycosyltransferase involved in cell wall biosynthesis
MRIVQIIDTLEIGGAEKMAVSFANSLASRIEFSGLVATRKEGDLKTTIEKNVDYLFLKRKHRFDLKAVWKLRRYCVKNKIEFIQAHSSSFFIACLIKYTLPKIKIIWHDHNGIGIIPKRNGTKILKFFSVFFTGVIAVNKELEQWSKKKLFCKNIIYIQNYVVEKKEYEKSTFLKGETGKRVLYLANLRHQKNHFLLIDVVKIVNKIVPDWTFHLVGMDWEDNYSNQIKAKIEENNLQNTIFIYGSKQDIENIINQSDIAIFTSNSEGLPVALLEYGLYRKPVVSTRVGQIPFIIENNKSGFISEVNDAQTFSNCLIKLMNDQNLRITYGEELQKVILDNYSEEFVIKMYLSWVKEIV